MTINDSIFGLCTLGSYFYTQATNSGSLYEKSACMGTLAPQSPPSFTIYI